MFGAFLFAKYTINMNYQKHYDTLIARGQRTLIHGYRENHHIIPKCMGGSNNKENLCGRNNGKAKGFNVLFCFLTCS